MTMLSLLQDCAATIEALIFASDRPVREREMEAHLPDGIKVEEVIAIVAARYDETRGIELCQIADGWAFRTRADLGERLSQYKRVERPLSRAALEVFGNHRLPPADYSRRNRGNTRHKPVKGHDGYFT